MHLRIYSLRIANQGVSGDTATPPTGADSRSNTPPPRTTRQTFRICGCPALDRPPTLRNTHTRIPQRAPDNPPGNPASGNVSNGGFIATVAHPRQSASLLNSLENIRDTPRPSAQTTQTPPTAAHGCPSHTPVSTSAPLACRRDPLNNPHRHATPKRPLQGRNPDTTAQPSRDHQQPHPHTHHRHPQPSPQITRKMARPTIHDHVFEGNARG